MVRSVASRREGESDGVSAKVVDGEPLAEERVTNDLDKEHISIESRRAITKRLTQMEPMEGGKSIPMKDEMQVP